jgi:hypothetical protein
MPSSNYFIASSILQRFSSIFSGGSSTFSGICSGASSDFAFGFCSYSGGFATSFSSGLVKSFSLSSTDVLGGIFV